MNYIWAGMILIGIIYGTLTGNAGAVSDAVLSSAKEAVSLCITMLGVVAFWSGLMEVAKESGLMDAVSKGMRPLIRFLFPDIPKGHPAADHIIMNCAANFLGLGWAATPAGLRAMKALEELEEERRKAGDESEDEQRKESVRLKRGRELQKISSESQNAVHAVPRGTASNEMCTFLILNISSLQLIPVNIIAYRAQYGSVNPTAVIAPGIVATAVSTGVAVVFCKMMGCRKNL